MNSSPVEPRTPAVSVVIPVYNRLAAVRRAVNSVLGQTVQDFEIIVVDDGSTDGGAAALLELGDERLKIVTHETNKGGSAARNSGIAVAAAPYVAFLDSDDEWLPRKLELQLQAFERADDSLALVYTCAERIDGDGNATYYPPWQPSNMIETLLTHNVIGETSLGMVRRSALEAVSGFDESLPSCQDLDLWLRLCERFQCELIPVTLARVMKGNDKSRISLNTSGTVRGRDLYCQKHRNKMLEYGVLHRFLRESGWWQHHRLKNPRKARQYYRESLRVAPLDPKTILLFLVSFFPSPLMNAAVKSKQLLNKVRRPDDQGLASAGQGPNASLVERSRSDSA